MLFAVLLFGCTPPTEEGLLVFASGRSGNGDIYVISSDSENAELLVGTEAPEGSPRFDPSSVRVIHTVFDPSGSSIRSAQQLLFNGEAEEFAPVWSATGQIAYVDVSTDSTDILVADSDNSNPRRVTADTLIERYPTWHPDGDRLAYTKLLETGWDLFEIYLPGGEETRLTFDGEYIGHPAWSPSGDELVIDKSFGTQTEIVVLNTGTGEIRRVTNNDENDLVPAWSLDGQFIAFSGVREGNWDVWKVPSSGGEPVRVTSDAAFDGGPVFVSSEAVK